MENFWQKLPKPFFVLAPMADVTDAAFRQIVAKYGKPDVMYTEFVSADGLCHPEGRKRLLIDLKYGENERPIVVQLFSSNPDKVKEAANLARELGFDGLDINMGCPDRTIEKQGAGAALMKNPRLAQKLVVAAKEGFDGPVSVKTRLGYSSLGEWENWISALIETKPASIAVHLRTRNEMSKVPAHWEFAQSIAGILKNTSTLAIGNGGVTDLADAKKKAEENNLDGVMIGEAIFGNPWLFAQKSGLGNSKKPGLEERLKIMIEHAYLFEEYFRNPSKSSGQVKSFAIMKKFFKAYISGHPDAKKLQEELMKCENASEVGKVVANFV